VISPVSPAAIVSSLAAGELDGGLCLQAASDVGSGARPFA
jgi:hypothetical protein